MVRLGERYSTWPEPSGTKDGLLCVIQKETASVYQCWTLHAGHKTDGRPMPRVTVQREENAGEACRVLPYQMSPLGPTTTARPDGD